MRYFYCFFISLFIFCMPAYGSDTMIHVKSAHDVQGTSDRLENVLKEKGMTVFLRIDHAKGAQKIGSSLRPTQLLIFGNPKVGTSLMQCSQSTGIDLPLKALIWKDKSGTVWLSYNDPDYLAQRHQIKGCEPVIEKVKKALHNFAAIATMP